MAEKVYYIMALYFVIGAIGTVLANRNQEQVVKQQRWVKYGVYLFIVSGMVSLLAFKPEWFRYVAILITALGCFEIIHAAAGRLKSLLLSASLFIYLAVSAAFIWFAFSAGPAGLLFVYTIVFCFDGFSQVTGQVAGRYKLSPVISPNKTIEGFVGGLIMGIVTAGLIGYKINPSWTVTLVISLLLCLSCLAGDLAASYYKRKTGIKDYSSLIPGHGGILDRFDSFIAAGAAYMLLSHIPV